jgi:glycosyltransferase involved in cell wall biosynthesis
MKKITIVSNTSWFVYNFFKASITEFMRDGNKVFIIAPKDNYTLRLQKLGCVYFDLPLCRSGGNIAKEIKTIKKLHNLHKEISPDCILNFTPKVNIYSTLSARLLNIPVINSVSGLGTIFSDRGVKSYCGKALLKFTQPLANHIVFQNNDDWKVYLKHRLVKKESSSRINGIGVNLKDFKPHACENDGVVRFILVARMLYNKGVPEFVEAANKVQEHFIIRHKAGYKVPSFEFSLLGFVDEGNPNSIPIEQLNYWNDNTLVNFLGRTDDVYSIVKNYDCVVLPSYYREGVPQCLIEAAAMAKPIITTDNVGCRETVEHNKSGFIVNPKSVPELKEAMIKMIELTHQQRLAFGEYGQKIAKRDFCHLKTSQHYLKVIEKIITH